MGIRQKKNKGDPNKPRRPLHTQLSVLYELIFTTFVPAYHDFSFL